MKPHTSCVSGEVPFLFFISGRWPCQVYYLWRTDFFFFQLLYTSFHFFFRGLQGFLRIVFWKFSIYVVSCFLSCLAAFPYLLCLWVLRNDYIVSVWRYLPMLTTWGSLDFRDLNVYFSVYILVSFCQLNYALGDLQKAWRMQTGQKFTGGNNNIFLAWHQNSFRMRQCFLCPYLGSWTVTFHVGQRGSALIQCE